MSNFKMEFYLQPRGVEVTFDCGTEENYLQVKAFLQEKLGLHASLDEPDRADPIFYYIETKQQKDALFSFLRTLRQ
ncbi:MAG: hypothetical protein QOD09_406 [Bradyrhizobium sp.]|jgi:hypothetical protein|nr:hypothetical protein [Bradyrhizobium sp.]